MKITKKDFVKAMCENMSIFAGTSRHFFTQDEIYCKLADSICDIHHGKIIVNMRECIEKSNHLLFTGGSRLGFDQQGRYYFHKYDLPHGDVYICQHCYHNDDFEDVQNVMYYIIMH